MSERLRGGDLIHAINKIIKSQIYSHNIDLSPNKKDRFSGAITMDLINEFEMINRGACKSSENKLEEKSCGNCQSGPECRHTKLMPDGQKTCNFYGRK